MQTPMQELIHWIEVRMSLYPDNPSLSERGAYDAYLNVLNIAKGKLPFERLVIRKAYNDGQLEYHEQHGNLVASNNYYNKTFPNGNKTD